MGEIDASSSSSDDSDNQTVFSSSDLDDDSYNSGDEGRAGVLDPSSSDPQGGYGAEGDILTHEPYRYLAVCNLYWTAVRAVDILAILVSFVPPGIGIPLRLWNEEDEKGRDHATQGYMEGRGVQRRGREGQH